MIGLQKERVVILEKLVGVLETVEDRRSANRAVDRINDLGDDVRDIGIRERKLLDNMNSKQKRIADEDLEDAMETDLGRKLKSAMRKMIATMAGIDRRYQADIGKAMATWVLNPNAFDGIP